MRVPQTAGPVGSAWSADARASPLSTNVVPVDPTRRHIVEIHPNPGMQAELAWRHERLAASRGAGHARRARWAGRRRG